MSGALLCAVAVAAGGLGLACVRTATPTARWLAFVVSVAFLVVAVAADDAEVHPVDARTRSVDIVGDDDASRTAMLAAAAHVGPRAAELTVRWRAPFAVSGQGDGERALGAQPVAPPSLPFAPDDVHVRIPTELAVDRPAAIELSVDGLAGARTGELRVTAADGDELLRRPVELGARAATVALLPRVAGRHEFSLQVEVGGHELRCTGSFDVAAADEVLVVEPAEVAAAALRAQGVRVRAARALPDDWSRHRTIVLDELLPRDQQELLVAAVLDGVGVFATARAFGPEGAPLRAILPLRLLPRQPEPAGDEGAGGERSDGEPADEPPADTPQREDPPPDRPPPEGPPPDGPIGDTDGSRPISPEPIEVDKHSIAMVLLIDRSYSMGVRLPNGQTKMSYAKSSALSTARALGEGDRVGIVTFGDKGFGRVAMAMQDAADERAVRRGIEQLAHAREDTWLLSGLRLARDLLEKERAAVKHCVVVTDGEYRMGEQVALRAEANRMRREGKATLSMISITDSATDPQFLQLAELLTRDGGGRFLPVQDPTVVPVLVSAEVTRALSRVGREPRREGADPTAAADPSTEPPSPKPPEDEPPPPPVEPDVREPEPPRRLPIYAVTESPLLRPEPAPWPTLGSAAATEAPLEARVLLVCGDDGWPLLAFANRGLGRVGAFGADLLGEAGGELRQAESFPAWFAQWVAATAPAQPAVDARERTTGGEVEPPAPVPDDVRWLANVAGAAPTEQPANVGAVVGYRARSRVGLHAPALLALLVLLAVAERALLQRRLRRGRA